MTALVGLLTLMMVLPSGAARAEDVCYHSAYAADLEELLEKAEVEYPKWESGQFIEISKQVQDMVPCLEEKLRPDLAARIHRVMGLRVRIVDNDVDRARMAFAASRKLTPKYRFPEDMVASGDPEHADYSAIPVALDITAHAMRPSEGTLRFDGRQTLDRPATFATIFQHIDDKGQVLETSYLWPGDPTPAYFSPETGEELSGVDPNRGKRYVLAGVSAGLVGAGVTLIGNGGWDQGHTCVGDASDSACVLQARDRVVGGTVLTVVGLAGFIGTGVLLDSQGSPAGLSLSGTW
ncbi:MAG: hypothetical protein JXX28_11930 [Deltaproteobacteria bacterium]|nr:hypothetical protein [Deltaproteobacteria bacterium]